MPNNSERSLRNNWLSGENETIEFRVNTCLDADDKLVQWIKSRYPLFKTHIDPDTYISEDHFHRYQHLGKIILSESSMPPQTYSQTADTITSHNTDHLQISIQRLGNSKLRTDNQISSIEPNHITILDMSQAASISASEMSEIKLIVPRRLVERDVLCVSSLHGMIIPIAEAPLNQLFVSQVEQLSTCLEFATDDQRDQVVDATISLCKAVVGSICGQSSFVTPTIETEIIRFIEENLNSMTAEKIMREFGISRTPLYKLFESSGGIYKYIRRRRLTYAMRILVQRTDGNRPTVKHLAAECGFENDQVFSRAFQRMYGCSPSKLKPNHRFTPEDGENRSLLTWLINL